MKITKNESLSTRAMRLAQEELTPASPVSVRRSATVSWRRPFFLGLLLLSVVLSMSSCRRAVEKARRNIRVEAVEKMEMQGLTGAEVVLRVLNDTRHKLLLNAASLDLYYAQERIGSIQLREPLEVAPRSLGSVSSRWRLRISNPLVFYVLMRKFRQDDLSQVAVSFSVEGRGGPAPIKISREMLSVSEFLNIFGLDLQTVKTSLKE